MCFRHQKCLFGLREDFRIVKTTTQRLFRALLRPRPDRQLVQVYTRAYCCRTTDELDTCTCSRLVFFGRTSTLRTFPAPGSSEEFGRRILTPAPIVSDHPLLSLGRYQKQRRTWAQNQKSSPSSPHSNLAPAVLAPWNTRGAATSCQRLHCMCRFSATVAASAALSSHPCVSLNYSVTKHLFCSRPLLLVSKASIFCSKVQTIPQSPAMTTMTKHSKNNHARICVRNRQPDAGSFKLS